MRKFISTLCLVTNVFLCSKPAQAAAILPPLNGKYILIEQNGTCFGAVGHETSEPHHLEIVSTEHKVIPAYVFESGLRHILNYSMRVGTFDQEIFGGAGIYRRVGEYTLDMRNFTFSEYSLPRNPTGFEKPQSFTVFNLDQDEVLSVTNPIAGWMCKFIRK